MSLGGLPPGHVYGEGGLDRIGCGRGGPSGIGCRYRGRGSCKRVRDERNKMERENIRVLHESKRESERGHIRADIREV